jgi:hypothetical protein
LLPLGTSSKYMAAITMYVSTRDEREKGSSGHRYKKRIEKTGGNIVT